LGITSPSTLCAKPQAGVAATSSLWAQPPLLGKEGNPHTMNVSRIFILRPVATSLFMSAILLAGIAGYRQLPVSALPQVDYPTIQVVTFYPVASAEVMASLVTAP